jgi:hypothetical protein
MFKRLQFYWYFLKYAYSRHPSWRIVYENGAVSRPLRHDDAASRAEIFGPARIEYCRDHHGDLRV